MTNQISSQSLLPSNGFRFNIKRLPHVNYFTQAISVPGLNMSGGIDVPTPFTNIPLPGGKLIFEPLPIKFRVDEDLRNYQEIFDWLVGLGHPDNFNQTRALEAASQALLSREGAIRKLMSDATLILMTAKMNSNVAVTFEDVFPISLTNLDLTTTDTDVEYLECTVVFRYRRFRFDRLA